MFIIILLSGYLLKRLGFQIQKRFYELMHETSGLKLSYLLKETCWMGKALKYVCTFKVMCQ